MKRIAIAITSALLLLGSSLPVFAHSTGSEHTGSQVMHTAHHLLREKRHELRMQFHHKGVHMAHAVLQAVNATNHTLTLQRGDSEKTVTVDVGEAMFYKVEVFEGHVSVTRVTINDLVLGKRVKLLVKRNREDGTVKAFVVVQVFRPETEGDDTNGSSGPGT